MRDKNRQIKKEIEKKREREEENKRERERAFEIENKRRDVYIENVRASLLVRSCYNSMYILEARFNLNEFIEEILLQLLLTGITYMWKKIARYRFFFTQKGL